jgi:xylulokinase
VGGDAPPTWSSETPEVYEDTSVPLIREQYAAARDAVIDRKSG